MELVYSPEKKAALTDVGPEYLRDWALSIPTTKLQAVIQELPSVKGFRPGKDGPFRLLTYFGRISRWSEQDWLLMATIWIHWTQANQAIAHGLGVNSTEQLIELAQGMVREPEIRRKTVTQLVGTSGRSVPQELIKVWYDMGPFPPDQDVASVIIIAPTAVDAGIPGRLASVEQKTNQLDSAVHGLNDESKAILGELRGLSRLGPAVSGLETTVRAIDQRMKQYEGRSAALEEALSRLTKTLDAQDQGARKLRTEVSGMQTRLKSVIAEIANWTATVDTLSRKQDGLTASVSSLSAQLKDLLGEVDRLALALEAHSTPTSISNAEAPVSISASPQPLIRESSASDPAKLESAEKAVTHLAKSLNLLGVKLPQAQALSLDVISALATGQLVSFIGSLAGAVAHRCALSLAGADVRTVSIPVGLMEGEFLGAYLEATVAAAASTKEAIGVIIEGANHSALEVYGTNLQRLVTERILGLSDQGLKLFVFVVLSDGPSTVPHGKGLLELGPMFNTDALGWLDAMAQPGSPGSARLSGWDLPNTEAWVDWGESWVPQWFSLRAGALWRRAAAKATAFRSALARGSLDPTQDVPSEMAFGWVLPMGVHLCPDLLKVVLRNVTLDIRGNSLVQLHGVDVESDE